jgi:NADPH:quinone reductase-like Zn-dependent oxidoreductase
VLIDVRAAGVNFPDVLLSYGKYQFKPPPPFVPGAEAAGVMKAVGQGVTACSVGERVAATMIHGAFAERIAVPRSSTARASKRARRLRPHVDEALPFSRGGEALTRLAKREVMGKIVLVP